MRRVTLMLVSAALTVLAAACARDGDTSQPRPAGDASGPIPLKEVRERGVEGRLGVPLGTVVEVTGQAVENRSRSKADAGEPFFLRVETVDDRRLEPPPLYASTAMPLADVVKTLKVGDSFRCVGYETGYYRGSPDREFEYVPARGDHGFHFAVKFIVLTVK